MDKTSQKVTKDPKRVEAARKSREKYMNKLKESILNDAKKRCGDITNASNETISASNETTSASNNASNETTSATSTATTHATSTTTTRSNDTYVYVVGMLAVFAIGAYVFFAYNTFPKKPINKKQDEPPKRRHML